MTPALARLGLWSYGGTKELSPRPSAVGIDLLPPAVVDLFRRAFVGGAVDPSSNPLLDHLRDWPDRTECIDLPAGPGQAVADDPVERIECHVTVPRQARPDPGNSHGFTLT